MERKSKEKKVLTLYSKGKTCTEIANELKLQRKSIYRILERNNIELTPREKRKCQLCEKEMPSFDVDGRIRSCCGTCSTNIRRYRAKKKAVEYKGCKCERCTWEGDLSGYDFHHTDPSKKDFEINARVIASMKWSSVKKELDKCIMLCAICHRIEHSRYDNEKFLKIAENNLILL